MRAVFLALGATRRRAVVEESAEVVAGGGTAVVVIEQAAAWQQEEFAPAVEVVELARLKARHPPVWLEQMFLYRGPRFLYRVLGRGPLRATASRTAQAYQLRVANRIHRRIFLPAYRRLWPDMAARLVERHVLRATPVPTLVAADPVSIPAAARIRHRYRIRELSPPTLCYSIDHVACEAPAARR